MQYLLSINKWIWILWYHHFIITNSDQIIWNFLSIVTVNRKYDECFNKNDARQGTVMDKTSFQFHIFYVSLPQDNVYYLCICQYPYGQEIFYISKTKKMMQQLRAHNSGHVSITAVLSYLRPFSLFTYIFCFYGNSYFMY